MSDDRPSDELDELSNELRARIDDEVDRSGPRPDFAALLERAKQIDPNAAPELDEHEAGDPIPKELEADHDEAADLAALSPYVAALRRRVDDQLAERRLQPTPAPPQASIRWIRWIGVAAVSTAAAALLVIGASKLGVLASRGETRRPDPAQAIDSAKASPLEGRARAHDPPKRPRERSHEPETQAPEPPAEPEAELPPVTPKPVRKQPRAPKASVSERIAALDAQAQAHWRAGRHRAAEAKFRDIIRIGGRQSGVELAYGELFALVRQQGRDPSRVWTAYLERFPRGRYAEDAQAGLCRRKTGATRERCWDRYRERFPGGLHAPKSAPTP